MQPLIDADRRAAYGIGPSGAQTQAPGAHAGQPAQVGWHWRWHWWMFGVSPLLVALVIFVAALAWAHVDRQRARALAARLNGAVAGWRFEA